MKPVFIYGSYGYTGRLIVEACVAHKISFTLGGRDAAKLQAQAGALNVPFYILDVSESENLKTILSQSSLVINCAGPFRFTAKPMALACIATKTHYVDITGEIATFEALAKLNQQAIEAGIMLLPGAGFDVVPTDCLAQYLKEKLPQATHLKLAFASSGGGTSRGTAKTAVLGLGYGSACRQAGKIIAVPFGETDRVDFGFKTLQVMEIPWGDVSTAWHSTGIPNIQVFMAAPTSLVRWAKASNYLGWLLRSPLLKRILLKWMDGKADPEKAKIQQSKSYVWGKVSDVEGHEANGLLETLSGYPLTAQTTALVAKKILTGNFKAGFCTPSKAYGAGLIFEIEGTKWLRQPKLK